ncbi:MAG: amidohydrolase family protein, partial [Candidatus Eremiobacteraeota bacterium]|nr:amidohydrolase family protein [Candidatus Eremiobacteraeota bacterium]
QRTGIGITLLLALYRHSDFSAHDVLPEQRRFVMSVDELVGTLGTLGAEFKEARIGVAPHSLRAVNAQDLKDLLASIPPETTVHMHIAEQRREVEASLRHYNERPVTWLLANAPVSSAWTLVHATHATQAELQGIAKSGAVVALAPTTEANLGDGIFSASEFHDAGGRFAIGSDSHVAIDPFAELRMLEYGQRLREAQRGILKRHYRQALQGGAQSLGIRAGSLEVGRRADFITLDLDDPALSGWPEQALLDAWIFGPARNPVRDVVAAGVQVVSGGRHRDREALAEAYKKTLRRLFS